MPLPRHAQQLQAADVALMILTYGLTIWSAAVGGKDRADTNPALPIAMSLKTLVDTATNLKLAQEEWQDNKAFCAYCQAASLLSLASVVLAAPEAARAIGNVLRR